MADLEPPVAKYKLTLTVYGNSHQEVQEELLSQVQGGYLIISEDEQRDRWRVCGDRYMSVMEHTNPVVVCPECCEFCTHCGADMPCDTTRLLDQIETDARGGE